MQIIQLCDEFTPEIDVLDEIGAFSECLTNHDNNNPMYFQLNNS